MSFMTWIQERQGNEESRWVYRDSRRERSTSKEVHVAFFGRGVPSGKGTLEALLPPGVRPLWLQQIHSARVIRAEGDGFCGDGDALISARPMTAPAVVTADCVPVLLASEGEVAAIHAGWRGVAQNIVDAALDSLVETPTVAWIGPCIGGDVYEVSPEVADQVTSASDESVQTMGPRGRPHLDLRAAVTIQLRRRGVVEVRQVPGCTFSEQNKLWSYRRQGKDAGRNVSLIWRH